MGKFQETMQMNLICDIDGTITSGQHFYSQDGKIIKSFGSNEKDALFLLKNYFNNIILCSADNTGDGPLINKKRADEMKIKYLFSASEKRQELIDSYMPCIYVGDGVDEPSATINICLEDSTPQAIENADVVLPTTAGKNVFPHILYWIKNSNIVSFANKIKQEISDKIIITGVGKNFSLAELVCEFFLPYNLVAIPLDANHSVHGSLGLIKKEDVIIASSKSGNTEELLNMIQALHKKFDGKKDKTFLITSNKFGKCNKFFDEVLVVENIKENSLYNLSPQTTIEQYLKVYFKILNIINSNNLCSKQNYLSNHPGGSIGKIK